MISSYLLKPTWKLNTDNHSLHMRVVSHRVLPPGSIECVKDRGVVSFLREAADYTEDILGTRKEMLSGL